MYLNAINSIKQEFEEVKRREVDADAPTEVDTTIPGWVCLFTQCHGCFL
jgi:U3 small nucleolar RNA-associated protein 14